MISSAEEQEILMRHFANMLGFIERRDWSAARRSALAAGAAAEAMNDAAGMVRAGDDLERLGEFAVAARLLAKGGRLLAQPARPEWDGTELPNGTLLIEQRIRDIGAHLRNARLLALAGKRAARCIVLTEPRLISLFSRTFPELDIRAKGRADHELRRQADVVASFETLMEHFAPNASALAATFSPLRTDPRMVRRFRESYHSGGSRIPVIGISWGSTNRTKDLPTPGCWAHFLQEIPAQFVSLQYGDVTADLARFQAAGVSVRSDPAIDSLRDLDGFAGQIASLDAVVTISNTTAHMAGALGVPTVVVLDDKFHLMWPVGEDHTPWYPRTILVRKQGRDWASAFLDVRDRLLTIVGLASG